MAEAYLFQSGAAQYRNGNIEGCIGGGEDYKTLSKGETQHVYLFHPVDLRSYSSACYVNYVEVSFGTKYTLTTGTPGWGSFTIYADILVYDKAPTVSGNTVEPSTGSHKVVQHYAKGPMNSSSSYVQCSPDKALTEEQTVFGGSNGMLGADFTLTNPGNLSCRIYLNNCRFTAKIYLACYVTFQGDGITTKKQKFEEGAVPSYGSTPTRVGYIFKGWKSGNTTYTGSLPTAGHTDVTYAAVWEKLKHTVTVTAGTGGTVTGGGTYDYGTQVTLTATPNAGYQFVRWSDGNTDQTRTITVTSNVTYTAIFEAVQTQTRPVIIDFEIEYNGQINPKAIPMGVLFTVTVTLERQII